MRKAGVLLPVFSLPGKYGIGTFGKEACRFVDRLKEAGQSYWQLLPLGPTGYGDSPYQAYSTFAGSPYYIDLEAFPETVLKKKLCDSADFGADPGRVDYGKLYENRLSVLYQAYQVENYLGLEKNYPDFSPFCEEQKEWLFDYALFMSLKEAHGGAPWYTWEEALKNREEGALSKARAKFGDRIRFHLWLQFHFYRQWTALKAYANEKGIGLIGDLPIYVSLDSSDVWARPELFRMDEKRRPVWVAGVPPDGFSASGQLWGNPVYDWEYHRREGYRWWILRMAHAFRLFDVVRIDHFRGFESFYCIPYGDETAERGHWQKGPGMELFHAVKAALGERRIIAEDLGFLTDEVRRLLSESGFPGMKILEFAFDAGEESEYLPHRWPENCVAYTGTHDNQTLAAWFSELDRKTLRFAEDYLNLTGRDRKSRNEDTIRVALLSAAETVIIPFADWAGFGAEARINHPATLGENWTFRIGEKDFSTALAKRMAHLTKLYGR